MNELQLKGSWQMLAFVGMPVLGVLTLVAMILASLTHQYLAAVMMAITTVFTGVGTIVCILQHTQSFIVVFGILFVLTAWMMINWIHKIDKFFFCSDEKFCKTSHQNDIFHFYFLFEALALMIGNIVCVVAYGIIRSGLSFDQRAKRAMARDAERENARHVDYLLTIAKLQAQMDAEKEKS